jgi:DNA invertase Pin-like site-specific DNA recombinase
MPPALNRIVLYVRVSTAGQSYASQEGELKQYCDARGWKDGDISIVREKVSGSKKSRPALDSIIGAARQGKIKTVVVFKMDRLGRSVSHLSWVINEFRRMGVALICTSQAIDTSQDSATGNMTANILSCFAELERDITRDRVRSGIAAARKRGSKLGRPRTSDASKPAAVALRRKGKTLLDISAKLGISRSTARRLTIGVSGPRPVRQARIARKPRKERGSKISPTKQARLALGP